MGEEGRRVRIRIDDDLPRTAVARGAKRIGQQPPADASPHEPREHPEIVELPCGVRPPQRRELARLALERRPYIDRVIQARAPGHSPSIRRMRLPFRSKYRTSVRG